MENKLRFCQGAEYFEEALPLGNGTLGAMVYGRCDKEKISLNHDTLWSGIPRRYTRENASEIYLKARKLALEDDIEQAEMLLQNEFTSSFGQSYLPLCNLFIECNDGGEVLGYYRELDMEKGIARVEYTRGGNRFEREYFVSHPADSLVVRFSSERPASYTVSMDCQLEYTVRTEGNDICLSGECPVSIAPSYAKDIVPTVYDGRGIKFSALCSVNSDGEIYADTSTIVVKNCTYLCLRFCAETSFISFDKLPEKEHYEACRARMLSVCGKTYEELRASHIADFSYFYNKVRLELGFESPALFTDERIKRSDKSDDLGLLELLFNFGRYLVIASSREGSQAANLQGIWNEELFAPWSSNYTVNINTQMNYWPVLMCGLAGMDMPIIELVKKISVTGADTARDFYGADGYCAHHNIDLWGLSTPVGAGSDGCISYAFWNMSAGWLCRHVWEHYEYTLDREYLENTAYPLMRGAALFYLSVLKEVDGNLVICPSTSPENRYYHSKGKVAALARYTAMSQAIVMDLFENISRAAYVLNIEDDFVGQIREKLPRLNTYEIGSHGQLLEYDRDFEEQDIHHRHTSHLYGLYPGESITVGRTPELAEACRNTLLRRGDVSTGWSMGWRVNLWAKLKDGDHALSLIKNQLTYVSPEEKRSWRGGGTYPNLFDAHPPFQIDGNFGVCAGIAQLFMQCEDGKICLLPALPTELENGSLKGLKAKGNIDVDLSWEKGKLTSFSLRSPFSHTVCVKTPTEEKTVELRAFEKAEFKVL
ncbi:MAG: glycoside hydrolase family 95 protein [Ruminococcaceae bacterium]|nr:glycoside hydrolase family 95 protein [Oscillospiraceae bacterium]